MAKSRFAGMTVNERLFEVGLFDTFDAAFRARDRDALIAIYRQLDLADQAEASVDTILANPDRYDPDRLRPLSPE